jgi:predicted RNase H-like HicB family nuclease
MKFTAVFEKVAEGYIAFVEELPGANSQGATLDEVEGQVGALERATGEAFEEMTSLQTRLGSEGAELRMAIQQWEDQAFADLDIVIAQRLEESGREEHREATDRNGTVRFQVPAGTWWVTARYDGIPFRELYWNIQVEVTRDGPVPIQLSPDNAEVRPRLGG